MKYAWGKSSSAKKAQVQKHLEDVDEIPAHKIRAWLRAAGLPVAKDGPIHSLLFSVYVQEASGFHDPALWEKAATTDRTRPSPKEGSKRIEAWGEARGWGPVRRGRPPRKLVDAYVIENFYTFTPEGGLVRIKDLVED